MNNNFWGKLIRDLREEMSLSQRALADRVPVNRKTLRALERGETAGDVPMLEKLLDFFGYDLEAIKRDPDSERFLKANLDKFDPEKRSKLARSKLLKLSVRDLS